ncbi:HD domain-containing protein [Streptomyces sp. 8K308]|nr:HD domain-containing protein [Streptomyces sp. 8K308]
MSACCGRGSTRGSSVASGHRARLSPPDRRRVRGETTAEHDARVIDFLTCWVIAGVAEPESVADHSHRTALIASAIAAMAGADPQRATFLASFHDSQETRESPEAASATDAARRLAREALGRGPLEWTHRVRAEKPEL